MIQEGNKTYEYGWLDKVVRVTENGKTLANFEYHNNGQIAKAIRENGIETFEWDGLALIERSGTKYINEPHVGGGNPILAIGGDEQTTEAIFTDMLGTSLGTANNETYTAITKTSFGADTSDSASFFTGKPYVEDLGYAFLFRNYRADMGKWLSADLIGYPDGWNNFAYCNNLATIACDLYGAVIKIDQNASGAWQTAVANALQQMKSSKTGMDLYNQLKNSSNIHNIKPGTENLCSINNITDATNGTGTGSIIEFNPDITSVEGWDRPPWAGLAHEMSHAGDVDNGTLRTGETNGVANYEIDACKETNDILREKNPNADLRKSYGGLPLPTYTYE